MEQAFLLLKNQNERWDEIIREYNERKFDELLAGFHQRNTPNKSLRLTSAQNSSKYHPSKNLHLARKLVNPENTSFRDENLRMNRGEELPLETQLTREPLGGRFVFPSHARAFMATQGRPTIDVPSSKRNAALNLYGFEGTPERYGKNQDPEGIIYGDLEEDSVHRLNKNPFILRDLQRAAGMFQPSYNAPSKVGIDGAERYRARELARMIMDAEIPGALIDPETARAHGIESFEDMTPKNKIGDITQIVNDLTGNIPMPTDRANPPLHGTFQQWERSMGPSGRVAELDETHTSPEQMQLLDDQLTAIPGAYSQSGQYYKSKPMDIAMRLLKMPFHGTTEDAIEGGRFFGGIKRRGLQPKSPGDGHAKNVFFTDSPIDAATYAKRGANQQNSRPVLIEFPENDVPTESQQSPFFAGDYRTTNQTIPSTNFQYHYGPQREGGMTDEQYNQQMNQWMRQMNKLQVQQPQVQQPQMIQAGEPMDLAMRLLKNEPADYADTYQQVRNNIATNGEYMTDEELNAIDEYYSELHDDESHLEEYYNLLEAIELEKKRRAEGSFDGIGHNEETGFTRSEPMEIAMQLLKERVSPEAKRHKLEYDKKYESSPERVKYREELNRERRRRHIMGQGGPDMSHTSQHTIVPEDPHTNRARHFKDKGTLL